MTELPDDGLEQLLRSGLHRHAAQAPDNPDLQDVGARAAKRRRRAQGTTLVSTALAVAVVLVFVVGSSSPTPKTHSAITNAPHPRDNGPVTGSLILPLTGTVEAGGLELENAGGTTTTTGPGGAGGSGTGGSSAATAPVPGNSGKLTSRGASGDQSVDVPPGTAQTLDRLSTHVSPDGVMVSTFYAANTESSPGTYVHPSSPPIAVPGTSTGGGAASSGSSGTNSTRPVSVPPVVKGPGSVPTPSPAPAPAHVVPDSCSPTGELTLEMSDTQAVATFTEPFYGGYTDPLIDVEIGEFGVTEERPATWVEAQVGPQAVEVLVQFADGATDSAAPSKGVAVLAHVGDASTTLGDGTSAYLEVLGSGGTVLAKYSIGVSSGASSVPPTPVSSSGNASSGSTVSGSGSTVSGSGSTGSGTASSGTLNPTPPVSEASQPAPPGVAGDAVSRALDTALSCSEPPVAQAQAVYGGGAYEELGGAGSSGLALGDRIAVETVTFTTKTSAVIRYHVATPGAATPQTLYADATLVRGNWLLSLGSVAPGLQIAPANQDGDVAVAPGGPLFVHSGPGGVAIAVYRAEASGATGSASGCDGQACVGAPDPQCVATGGTVEEITTSGAVGIESGPLFGNYTTPLISIALTIVGEAEGAPATVVGTEVGPGVTSVDLIVLGHAQAFTPVDGVVDAVLAGAPSVAIGPTGGSLDAVDASGATVANVPLAVDASEPAPASTLPGSLPAPGTPPSDPAAATAAIDNVFETVFSCASSPLVRADDIQDNGMFANPLEQLYLGGYTNLVESVYSTVNQVVFVDPTLADVSYTIRFHDDPTLTFDMIGTSVAMNGAWRVSYATLCGAVALGGVSCSS